MSALALLAAAALGAAAPAQSAPPPSSPGLDGVPVKVERRLLVKTNHFFVTGGLNYFIRGDYYVNPGLVGTLSLYGSEQHGVEVKAGVFISFMSPSAQEIFNATGLLPDSHRPVGLLAFGYRYSAGYGKVMLAGTPASLIHFDFQLTAHAGAIFTDKMVSPALSVAPAVLVRFNPRVFLQVDLSLYASYETRQSIPVALGFLPTLTGGLVF
jgi:hypothetical protein